MSLLLRGMGRSVYIGSLVCGGLGRRIATTIRREFKRQLVVLTMLASMVVTTVKDEIAIYKKP